MEYKYNDKVEWFMKNKSGFGKIIGKVPIDNKCSGWIILNENEKLFDNSNFPTIIAYDKNNSPGYLEYDSVLFKYLE